MSRVSSEEITTDSIISLNIVLVGIFVLLVALKLKSRYGS